MFDSREATKHIAMLMLIAQNQLGYTLRPRAISGQFAEHPMKLAYTQHQHIFIMWYDRHQGEWHLEYVNAMRSRYDLMRFGEHLNTKDKLEFAVFQQLERLDTRAWE